MTAAAILRETAAAGVTLSLSPAGTIKAAGEKSAVDRWLPTIREHKGGIVTLLAEAANIQPFGVSRCWLLHFPDHNSLEVAFSPAVSHAEVMRFYPETIAAEPFDDAGCAAMRPRRAGSSADGAASGERKGEAPAINFPKP